MTKLTFERQANRVTRATLIRGNEKHVTQATIDELLRLPFTISDLLMRHEGVCFSIYGENLVIPVLLKAFGPDGTLRLLKQGAIKFHLQSTIITHAVTEVPGVLPLQSGNLTSPVHSDPEASVDESLRRLKNPPAAPNLRHLRRALSDAYLAPSADYAQRAVALAHEGYSRGRFAQLGLPPDREVARLDLPRRAALNELATELQDLAIVADLKMNTLDEFTISRVSDDSLKNLARAKKIAEAAVAVFKIENVPQVATLFEDGTLKTQDVPTLRENRNVVRFRKWLAEVADRADAAEVGREYVDAVTHRKKFFEKAGGKLLKTLGVTGLSALGGAVIAGPIGGTVGAAAGPVIDKGLDVGIDLLDEFVLDGILKGWQPRNYFDKVIRPALGAKSDSVDGSTE